MQLFIYFYYDSDNYLMVLRDEIFLFTSPGGVDIHLRVHGSLIDLHETFCNRFEIKLESKSLPLEE